MWVLIWLGCGLRFRLGLYVSALHVLVCWAGCLVRVWVCDVFGGLRCLGGLLVGALL